MEELSTEGKFTQRKGHTKKMANSKTEEDPTREEEKSRRVSQTDQKKTAIQG